MLVLSRILALIVASCVVAQAQARFPMKYLDDVGLVGLGLPYSRNIIDLGLATVVSKNDALLFEGHDRKGDSWHAWVPQTSGVGWTEVWTADFDHNGQRDLLIAVHPGINGRCTGRADLLFLLFDQTGRPSPWYVSTEIPNGKEYPYLPAILLDLNSDGRAEILSTACEYGDQSAGHWTDWSITGVYEARDTQWIPLRSANSAPYIQAATRANGIKTWLPLKPSEWPDQGIGRDAPNSIALKQLIPSDEHCHGINIPIGPDGPFIPLNDPCDELRHDRALYSDGRTRRGWPSVVIDGLHGREIFIANNEAALRRVIEKGYRVKLLGDDAEPSWLWAEEAQAVVPLP